MRNLKRVLSLALACVMVIGMMVMTTGAADFDDAAEIKYTEAVEVMAALGVLEGHDGIFNPDGELYRDQAAKIICFMLMGPDKAVALEGAGTGMFNDTKGSWAEGYIEYCANLGIVNGWNGNFAPDSKLTFAQFGKMLLCALGYDAAGEGYNGDNWSSYVFNQLVEFGMDLEGVAADTVLTREQAAQMAFQTLTQTIVYYDGGMNVTTSDGTTVTVDADRYNKGEGIYTTYKMDGITPVATASLQFVERYFEDLKLDVAGTTDAYGRTIAYQWVLDGDAVYSSVAAPSITYTKGMDTVAGKKVIAADLKGYKLAAGVTVAAVVADTYADLVWTDGVEGDLTVAATKTGIDAIAALTTDTNTVEIFVNKQTKLIENIVVTNTYADTVATVVEADEDTATDAYITLTNGTSLNTIETDAFEQGDVVIYTKAYDAVADDGDYDVVTIVAADTFTGTLTSYTEDNKFTINGKVYEASAISGVTQATVQSAIKDEIGVEQVYALDQNGDIIAVNDPDGAAPVVIKDYAIVLDAKGTVKTENAKWPATGSTTTVTAKIQVLLSDGTVEVWDVPVYKADKAIDGTSIGEGDFYYYLASTTPTKVAITGTESSHNTADSGTLTTALKVAGVYTHADKALVAAVGNLAGTETQNGTKLFVNDHASLATITKASYTNTNAAGKTVILNDQTVFVLAKVANDISKGFVVKTGLAALEDTSIAKDKAQVVTAVTAGKAADGVTPDTAKNVNVATVVFVDKSVAFDGADASATDDYVYVDGNYTYSVVDEKDVYTYSVVYADGTTGTISTETEALDTAVYKLKTDGTVDTATKNDTKLTVKVVSGTTVVLSDGTGMTTNAKTEVVSVVEGGALKAGAEMYVVETAVSSKIIALAFIVK